MDILANVQNAVVKNYHYKANHLANRKIVKGGEVKMSKVFDEIYREIMLDRSLYNLKPDFIVLGINIEKELLNDKRIIRSLSCEKINKFYGIEIVHSDNENEMSVCYKHPR